MMASSKGLGLPRSMLLFMLLFTSLAQILAEGEDCEVAKEASPISATDKGCLSASSFMKCNPETAGGATGKCKCPTDKPKFDAAKPECKVAGAAGTPTTTAGSKAGSADSSAVRTFIPSIIALAGLALGLGVLSTF